ncbi:protein ABHD13-like [Littorina saxatilis]|uniref:Protein ABHD13 n=1 Tax=Littorina saxatilis TaxID=31220 RepID=A0AAN9AQW7_9CAEN
MINDQTVPLIEETDQTMPGRRSFVGKGLATIELVSRIVLAVVVRFWRLCTTGLLIIILLFCIHGGILAFTFLVLGILGLMYNAQDMLLYHPEVPPESRLYVILPSAFHLPFENHTTQARDGTKINIVLVKQPKPGAPTILYFHGNAGNIGHRMHNVLGLHTACGFNVLLVEYRGYGRSEGSPSEGGFYLDAEAAMDFLLHRSDLDTRQIFVFGRSLGGAVAIYLASSPLYAQHIRAVIVENTFTSIPAMGQHIFRTHLLSYIPSWCYKNLFPSLSRIPKVQQPTLFMCGKKDELVPPVMMQSMYSNSGSDKKKIEAFPGGTHNETWTCPGYYEAIISFMVQVLKEPRRSLELPSDDSSENSSVVDLRGYTI